MFERGVDQGMLRSLSWEDGKLIGYLFQALKKSLVV